MATTYLVRSFYFAAFEPVATRETQWLWVLRALTDESDRFAFIVISKRRNRNLMTIIMTGTELKSKPRLRLTDRISVENARHLVLQDSGCITLLYGVGWTIQSLPFQGSMKCVLCRVLCLVWFCKTFLKGTSVISILDYSYFLLTNEITPSLT